MSHISVQSPPAVSQLRVRARASCASPPRPPATRASTPAVLFWPHGLHRCLGALVPCTFTTPADSALSSDHCSELPFSGRSSYGFAKAPVTKSHMLSGLRDRNGLSCGSGGWKSETKVLAGCISSKASLLGLETVIISPCPLHELPHVHLCPRLLFFLQGNQPS